ncbi:hypothetical protein Tco_1531510 [Tanacetum coccineum]
MDEFDIEDLTIEQYLKLTQKNQTPKKIEDMTIAEYLEYDKKVNENHISNTKSYFPTDLGKTTPIRYPIWEFAHYFDLNQPGAESDYDSEEEDEYMNDDEVVMSEQEKSNHVNTQSIQHFEEKDDVDEWLNAEIAKHMSMQGVENTEDALISIIKSIKKEMKDDIVKKQFEASTASVSNETSSNNEEDKDDNNTSFSTSCLLPKELGPRSFLLPFNINNHSLYAITTLEAKDNIMPLDVYKYLRLDKLRDVHCHNNQHESDREVIFNEWILDSYDVKKEYANKIGNPYSRRFDEYNRVFNNEIEHLSNEYILRIEKKGYILDNVWEKCQQNYKKTDEAWHDEGYEEDEIWQSGDEKTDYDPPYVNVKTFEVKKYYFNEGRSFICITDREDEALPLRRVNGARFKDMIRNELEGNKCHHLAQDLLVGMDWLAKHQAVIACAEKIVRIP